MVQRRVEIPILSVLPYFELFCTVERKMKTKKERVKRLYNVLRKVLAGKVINEESLREGFHKTKTRKIT